MSIQIASNNQRTLELHQTGYDEPVTVTIYSNKTKEVDHTSTIKPEDMTMLINYYTYVKSNNIQCDFINPYGKKEEK